MLLGIKRRAERSARRDAEPRTQTVLDNRQAAEEVTEATTHP
jgi:hypothetical protein